MREFFRGWRRKTGLLTLLMALVMMGGWINSPVKTNGFVAFSGRTTTDFVLSQDLSITWGRFHEQDPHYVISFPRWKTDIPHLLDDSSIEWRWRLCGFGAGRHRGKVATLWLIPYWSVVLPLTLLSAYLLLCKPHIPTSKTAADPVTSEET